MKYYNRALGNSVLLDTGGTYRGYYSPLYESVATDFMCVPVIESYENIDTVPTHQRNIHTT